MKYSELRKLVEDTQATSRAIQRKADSLREELEITRSIAQVQLGEVPRGVAVEFRIKQQTDAMMYEICAGRAGFKDALENTAVRAMMREIVRQGFVVSRSESSFRDSVMVTEYSIRVVRP